MAIVYGVGPKRVFGCGFMHLAGSSHEYISGI